MGHITIRNITIDETPRIDSYTGVITIGHIRVKRHVPNAITSDILRVHNETPPTRCPLCHSVGTVVNAPRDASYRFRCTVVDCGYTF